MQSWKNPIRPTKSLLTTQTKPLSLDCDRILAQGFLTQNQGGEDNEQAYRLLPTRRGKD